MIVRAMILVVALVLVSSGSAYGATVLSSGALAFVGLQTFHCTIVNTTRNSIAVSLELVQPSGVAIPIGSCASLVAHGTCSAAISAGGFDLYCRATVTGAGKSTVRGELCNLDGHRCSQLR